LFILDAKADLIPIEIGAMGDGVTLAYNNDKSALKRFNLILIVRRAFFSSPLL
tara:strand:- start:76 stop:234 length:159 start_codon:yes stop_codon:yes gene_type:complete